ncbi:MAG TPA: DNA repair exonuclease [Clostridia bacterium]|nr:DNA repair exonuclease [Clostridia bacterium]
MRIKFLQCGDLHLDSPFTSLADTAGIADMRRQDLKSTFSGIIELADHGEADAVLICGDLYEHGYVKKSTIRYVCDQVQRIPDIPVIMIPGNHDPAVPEAFYSSFEWPQNVHILTGKNKYHELPQKRTRIYGGVMSPDGLDPAYINILIYHGTLDMPFSSDAFQPVSSSQLAAAGFDYCAFGHFHTIISGAGSGRNIFNAGSPEPLGFDEEGEHGVIIADVLKSSDAGTEIHTEFVKICRRHFISIETDIGVCLSDEQAADKIVSDIVRNGSSEDLYRVFLCGYVSREFRPNTELIRQLLKEKTFYLKLIDRTVPDYDFTRIAGEPGLRGLFARKLLDRAAAASGEEERQLVMQALYYGMEAIDEGKVCV